MLSPFPMFLSYGQLSPLLIRIILGAILIFWSYRTFRSSNVGIEKKAVGLIEGIAGILIVVGLWTQIAAMIVVIDLVMRLIQRIMKKAFLTDGVNYYLVLLVMATSLIVTSAGWLAFDLPL